MVEIIYIWSKFNKLQFCLVFDRRRICAPALNNIALHKPTSKMKSGLCGFVLNHVFM